MMPAMGNMFGNIISFLLSPPGLIIVFGLIGGLGRLGAWFQSERTKRTAVQNQARREAENLRTGRPVAMGSLREPTGSAAPSDEQDKAERQRALQAQRTAQLRALQQKRLAELRARRSGQQGGSPVSATPTASAPERSVRPTMRPQQSTPMSRGETQAAAGAADRVQNAPARRTPRPARPEPQPVTTPFNRPARPMPSARPATAPVEVTEIGGPVNPAVGRAPAPVAAPVGIGPLVALRNDLRRAVMIAEVLGPPVSERDPDRPGAF
tara:strand:+ start:5758 stop:6558 length:801 start_codon:yes stop_codon:yes gene_type:complete